MPLCGTGEKLTPTQRFRQTMGNVTKKLHQLKEDLHLTYVPPVLCPPPIPKLHTCPVPCKPTIRCRPAGTANLGSPCNVRISKKCQKFTPYGPCDQDPEIDLGDDGFEGLQPKPVEKPKEITCPSGKGLCNCSLAHPCVSCLMDTIKNLLEQLNGDECEEESDDCGESCPPPCKKPNDGCCPTKPTCPCCSDLIDRCLLQLCPATPLSPANRCWLIQRGQCIINFAKQKYVAPFCTKPEEFLPSLTGDGWQQIRACFPPKKRADFQLATYDPYILHAKKSRCKKAAYCGTKVKKAKKK